MRVHYPKFRNMAHTFSLCMFSLLPKDLTFIFYFIVCMPFKCGTGNDTVCNNYQSLHIKRMMPLGISYAEMNRYDYRGFANIAHVTNINAFRYLFMSLDTNKAICRCNIHDSLYINIPKTFVRSLVTF